MKGLDNPVYLWGWIAFNILAILFLVSSVKKPGLARLLYFLLFAWASCTNWVISQSNPSAYLEYAELAFSDWYRSFISGWFSHYIQWSVGVIATCQALIAVSMVLKGWIYQLGCTGGIVFLVAIAPLGVGSGFPCTLIFAIGLIILYKKGNGYLWRGSKKMKNIFFESIQSGSRTRIHTARMHTLPPVVQKWLIHSGITGKERISCVRLMQEGKLKTKQGGKWMPFKAEQYFNVERPAFTWRAHVNMMPFVFLKGTDQFADGKGNMSIRLWDLVPVVKEKENEKINSATMVRFLAETAWFPTAALNDYIQWEPVNDYSAKAIMTYKNKSISGIFTFDENGDLKTFAANRYMESGKDAKEEKWLVEMTGYKDFWGWRIPYKNKVTWQLESGDFTWAEIEITKLDFNLPVVFK